MELITQRCYESLCEKRWLSCSETLAHLLRDGGPLGPERWPSWSGKRIETLSGRRIGLSYTTGEAFQLSDFGSERALKSAVKKGLFKWSEVTRFQFFHNHPNDTPLSDADINEIKKLSLEHARKIRRHIPHHIYAISQRHGEIFIHHFSINTPK